VRMLAESLFDRERLKLIVVRRRRAVRIDVTDLIGSDTCVPQTPLHDATRARAGFVGHCQVKRISAGAITDNLAVYPRATFLRGFELFENHDSRALADNKAVTISFKWPRSVERIVVVGR